MIVEEILGVEAYELADEPPIGITRRRLDLEVGDSEVLRKIMNAERYFADHAIGSASAAIQCPEQIGIVARIRDAYLSVCRNNVGFEQARGRRAKVLRVASEATALD